MYERACASVRCRCERCQAVSLTKACTARRAADWACLLQGPHHRHGAACIALALPNLLFVHVPTLSCRSHQAGRLRVTATIAGLEPDSWMWNNAGLRWAPQVVMLPVKQLSDVVSRQSATFLRHSRVPTDFCDSMQEHFPTMDAAVWRQTAEKSRGSAVMCTLRHQDIIR
jgi:hypothetical protein